MSVSLFFYYILLSNRNECHLLRNIFRTNIWTLQAYLCPAEQTEEIGFIQSVSAQGESAAKGTVALCSAEPTNHHLRRPASTNHHEKLTISLRRAVEAFTSAVVACCGRLVHRIYSFSRSSGFKCTVQCPTISVLLTVDCKCDVSI